MLRGQESLWCGCGAPLYRRGLCRRCLRRERLSRECFGGLRDRILSRDERQCQCCGELEERELLVHHRRPGLNHARLLVTLCRRCHTRIHRTWRPRYGFAGLLRALWREQHKGWPEQRELSLGAGDREFEALTIQEGLFDAA